MAIRVVQWTTGNVGRRALAAIVAHPDLELVGCFAHSADKVGRDAGELCGIAPVGVAATNDVDALLALDPDCVSYNPIWFDVDEVCRFLGAGVDVATTSEFITGRHLGAERVDRLQAAALAGGATLFGSGVNPGFANLFGLVTAGICERVDRISVLESVDASGYASAETQLGVGFAGDPDDPGTAAKAQRASAVFGDAVALMGDALGVELTEIGFEVQFARATQDVDLGFMLVPQGTVSAIDACWYGMVGDHRLVECKVLWLIGQHHDPDWNSRVKHGYFVEVEGSPRVRSQFQILPPKGWSEPDFMGLGMIMTAMPAVNAIPAVVAAAPGIATYRDLPLITAAATAGR
jgi:2,4-diaminopentanoate dehydrogenase